MKFSLAFVFSSLLALTSISALAQSISPVPGDGDLTIKVDTTSATAGTAIKILTTTTAGKCSTGNSLPLDPTFGNLVLAGNPTSVQLQKPVTKGQILCAVMNIGGTPTPTPEVTVGSKTVNTNCLNPGTYSDCTFEYLLIGGIEQADLSAQSSVTEGFFDLFLRRPVDSKWGSIWFRSRYLGAPSSSSTQNVVAAASNPSGTLTAANLPQSVVAVDYMLGMQLDFGQVSNRRTTYSPVFGFGATTPLGANTAVTGFVVPPYGTNECNQLQARFGVTNNNGYNPPLPPSVAGTGAGQGCVVENGTTIEAIAFSNEDRSSFLLKWGAGVRIIDRGSAGNCSADPGCKRVMADFTVGQDEEITGGELRKFVFKTDAIIPVFSSGTYFFASSANRIEKNTTLSPLILAPVTIGSSNGTSACTAAGTTICIPSPTVFVLPYKQQNRDYYRIGVGIDLTKVFTGLINVVTPKTQNQ
jgi:hypothetical protein